MRFRTISRDAQLDQISLLHVPVLARASSKLVSSADLTEPTPRPHVGAAGENLGCQMACRVLYVMSNRPVCSRRRPRRSPSQTGSETLVWESELIPASVRAAGGTCNSGAKRVVAGF